MEGVDPRLQDFADHVIDRLLGRAADLFPRDEPDMGLGGGEPALAPIPPAGDTLSGTAQDAGNELARRRALLRGLDEDSAQAVAAAGEAGRAGRAAVEQLREQARRQASAILRGGDSAAGARLLVSTLDQSLGAVQEHIATAEKANAAAAVRLRDIADSFRRRR